MSGLFERELMELQDTIRADGARDTARAQGPVAPGERARAADAAPRRDDTTPLPDFGEGGGSAFDEAFTGYAPQRNDAQDRNGDEVPVRTRDPVGEAIGRLERRLRRNGTL